MFKTYVFPIDIRLEQLNQTILMACHTCIDSCILNTNALEQHNENHYSLTNKITFSTFKHASYLSIYYVSHDKEV